MNLMSFRNLFSTRCARIATSAAAVISMSVSAFGQSGQSPLGAAIRTATLQVAQPADQPTGPVRRLTMDEAVKLALEQNLGIKIQRMDPQIQDLSVATARSAWAPNLTTQFNRNSATTQSTNAFSATNNAGTFSNGVGMNQVLPWGGSYNANWFSSRQSTNDPVAIFAPQLASRLDLQYTQPLVRNFSIDQIRQQVENSQKVRELSDIQLLGVITQTTRGVRNAYWDLAYAIANLKAQQQSLALSQQSLKDNQKRVEIGTMAPIDIVQAQAEVASNEQGVIIADAAIKTAQDNLRALILDPGAPEFWTVSFDPIDAPAFAAQAIDVDAAVRNALDNRSDLKSAKNSLEQSDINMRYYRNQVLPDVNAQVNYGASGVAGTLLDRSIDSLTGATSSTVIGQRSYGSALSDVFSNAFPQWSVGVQIGY